MHLSFIQTIFLGFLQGITELFPISSLGHAVLVPAWIGGSFGKFVSENNDSYLSITVAMHLASAIALFIIFRRRWIEFIYSAVRQLAKKPLTQAQLYAARVFWLVVIATIPVGILGAVFQKKLTHLFGDPKFTAIFLTINGVILVLAERVSRSRKNLAPVNENVEITEHISNSHAAIIGLGQSAALFAGISRFGISMSAGLVRGLNHRVASDFAFLLSLPVILAAAVLKIPHLIGHSANVSLGPILAGSFVSFVATYVSITFLVKWFKTKTLYPFAIYCLLFGIASIIKFH
ncbi:MAG: undecaprenyl-diphosphate phosphatase [Actinomycetes bacterium]